MPAFLERRADGGVQLAALIVGWADDENLFTCFMRNKVFTRKHATWRSCGSMISRTRPCFSRSAIAWPISPREANVTASRSPGSS